MPQGIPMLTVSHSSEDLGLTIPISPAELGTLYPDCTEILLSLQGLLVRSQRAEIEGGKDPDKQQGTGITKPRRPKLHAWKLWPKGNAFPL